jgi:hypothetical protein
MTIASSRFIGLVILTVLAGSFACGQSLDERIPHRVITAAEIQKAGDEPFQKVLHYLLPEVFPKTDQAWLRTIHTMSFYVDHERFEPECINGIRPDEVKQILIWEKPWEPSPTTLPTLDYTKYVVSIETIRYKRTG